jgi:hypothetical protein
LLGSPGWFIILLCNPSFPSAGITGMCHKAWPVYNSLHVILRYDRLNLRSSFSLLIYVLT